MTQFNPGDRVTVDGKVVRTRTVIGPDSLDPSVTVVQREDGTLLPLTTARLTLVSDLMPVFLPSDVVKQIAEFWCGNLPTIHIVVGDGCRATLAAEAGD